LCHPWHRVWLIVEQSSAGSHKGKGSDYSEKESQYKASNPSAFHVGGAEYCSLGLKAETGGGSGKGKK
jgi:hypothetical protein